MQDIQKIMSLPEGKTLEFKRDLSSLSPILKTLIAFANTSGGTLVIGRDNDGKTIGVDDVFHSEEKIANVISDNISPQLLAEIDVVSFEDRSLIVIRVAHWRGPFYLKSKGPELSTFIRLGSTNRLASPEQIAELKRSLNHVSFDQLPCPEVGIDGLNKQRIQKAFSAVGRKVNQNHLETLGILVPYSGELVCSNGGIILFGNEEIRKRIFPNSMMRCARFQGTDKVNFIDQYDVEGSILDSMVEVPKFIRRNTRMAAKIERIHREDIPEYSSIAIREALTNALVHADYSIKGMNPRLAIFSDRMEIESPGMLPFGYTLDDFMAGISHIRNKVIARVFRELQLMEEWGTGYKRIVESCLSGGYPEPSWEEIGTSVRVILKPHAVTKDLEETNLPIRQKSLTIVQKEVLGLFKPKMPLTAKTIYNRQKLQLSERTLRSILLSLKDLGYLEMLGGGRSTSWLLK